MINHLVSEVVTFVMSHYKIRNLETTLMFNLLWGCMVLAMYYYAFSGKYFKKLTVLFIPFYIVSFILVYFVFDYNLFLPSVTFAWFRLLLLIPVLLYFFEKIHLLDDILISENPMFWISCGLLLFYSVSIFYFALNNYLYFHYPEISKNALLIHSTMLLTMNILLTTGICKIQKAQPY
jgi:hypothetical protein